jgi:hypothetical protein
VTFAPSDANASAMPRPISLTCAGHDRHFARKDARHQTSLAPILVERARR